MANISAAQLARNKKHFLGVPAPLGYVAGVGRGYVLLLSLVIHFSSLHIIILSQIYFFSLANNH